MAIAHPLSEKNRSLARRRKKGKRGGREGRGGKEEENENGDFHLPSFWSNYLSALLCGS